MNKSFKLSYKVTTPSGGVGNCSGILFDTEESLNRFLDLEVASGATILEMNVSEVETPRERRVFATTRSYE